MKLDEETIWRLTKMIDVCLTNLLPEQQSFGALFNTRKWTEVIIMDRFKEVAEFANEVYAKMTRASQFCPTVTPYDKDGILLRYRNENQITEILICPRQPMQYRFSTDRIFTRLTHIERFDHVIKTICNHLDFEGETVNPCKEIN